MRLVVYPPTPDPDDPDEPDDPTPTPPPDEIIEWGEIKFDENYGIEIVPVDEDDVPLQFKPTHNDAALPFIFVMTAFLTQLAYFDERKKHQKKMFELKKCFATGEKPEEAEK